MFQDISKPPAPAPMSRLHPLGPGAALFPPLLRSTDRGPGLVVVRPDVQGLDPGHDKETVTDGQDPRLAIIQGVPSLGVKWAEEGYTVVEVQQARVAGGARGALDEALAALAGCEACEPRGKVGIVVYTPELWELVGPALDDLPPIVAAISYTDAPEVSPAKTKTPTLRHVAGSDATSRSAGLVEYGYPQAAGCQFAHPHAPGFDYVADTLAHTRNLAFLKPRMGGPYFDLESIWEEHTYYEFADRSVEHTMSTMVAEPYVNHVPTMTGGIGRASLSVFYRDSFIFNNSVDTSLELISRTVGIDRVIDEFIFKFTHDKELDWLLPGLPPTGKKVEVPFTAVVNIRGDRLYHEHIAWDQGTVLRQLGLLPEWLPYDGPVPESLRPAVAAGRRLEYRVPVGGAETAGKMRDRNGVPSNAMFGYQLREVD